MGALYQPVIGWISTCYLLDLAHWQGVVTRILRASGSPGAGGRVWLVSARVDRRVSRWARLAGIRLTRFSCMVCFLLPGETELGSAEEQPNKG